MESPSKFSPGVILPLFSNESLNNLMEPISMLDKIGPFPITFPFKPLVVSLVSLNPAP